MTRFLAVAALLAPVPLCAADKPAAGVPVGGVGVVSVDVKAVFVPAKDGGIEALDLASGRVLWVNKDANKLAGASDKLVLGWVGDAKKANAFRVVAIDADTGKTVGKSDAITLPNWATTAKTWGRTFRTAATADGENVVVVWQAGAFYSGGAAPPPEVEAAARKNESGVAKVELKTGTVTAAGKPKDADFAAGPAGGSAAAVGGYEFRTEEQLPGFKPGAAMVTKVTLTVRKGGKDVWKRELAGNPWSPPPP